MSTDAQQQNDCFICRKHRSEITIPGGAIYEDNLVYAGHVRTNQGVTYLGYLIAELKRHAPGWPNKRTKKHRQRDCSWRA